MSRSRGGIEMDNFLRGYGTKGLGLLVRTYIDRCEPKTEGDKAIAEEINDALAALEDDLERCSGK